MVQVVVCWLVADFISGLFHWWEDQYADESWPIIGPLIATPNQIHHRDPLNFTKAGYWERNWTTLVPSALFGLCIYPHFLWPAFIFLSQANEVHAWSHQKCNKIIRVLQEMGICQHPRRHAKHHRIPFSCNYCVMSEFVNPLLEALYFWRVLEFMIGLVGIKVKVR